MKTSPGDARNEIRAFVERRLAAKEGEASVSDDESLVERGVVDSMGIFQLVAFLEERFGIRIPDEKISQENFGSVNKIVDFVEAQL